MIKKWYFALSESSIESANHGWRGLIRVAIRSARENTDLQPHMLYDGNDNDFTEELQRNGVQLIKHRVSFYDNFVRKEEMVKGYLPIASGAFLRVEIPLVEQEDDFILYTDVDVVFQDSFNTTDIVLPELFSCAPEFSQTDWTGDLNSGVMVMNVPAMRRELPKFIDYIRTNIETFSGFDQEMHRQYFYGRWDNLPIEYNWKPYWGKNPNAKIVHWHGPKPKIIRRLLTNPASSVPVDYTTLFNRDIAGYAAFLAQWDLYAEPPKEGVRGCVDMLNYNEGKGWVLNVGDKHQPLNLSVEIDGVHACSVVADRQRLDLVPFYGVDKAGFQLVIPDQFRVEGKHTMRLRLPSGELCLLWYKGEIESEFLYEGLTGETLPTLCYVDSIDPYGVCGWAFDTGRSEPVRLHLMIDGDFIDEIVCDIERPDVAETGMGLHVGFRCPIPRKFFDNQPHMVRFEYGGRTISFTINKQLVSEYMLKQHWCPKIISNIDGIREGVIQGWVLVEDPTTNKRTGLVDLLVTCEGVHITRCKANKYRPDVAKHYAADAECGFGFIPPPEYRRGRQHAFKFYVLPYNIELPGSPVVTSMVTDQQQADLILLSDEFDVVHRELTRLRRRMNLLIPRTSFTLEDYDAWTQNYFPRLRRETQKRRLERNAVLSSDLVSIICPTYRPELDHFVQAVESIIDQTYENWELLIVDDGSGISELTDRINQFAGTDGRIRAIHKSKNGGISAATNTGIEAATGRWIAFFDHDDLLVDTALEIMLMAAARTGARVIYSDEDKIDDDGLLSEPAFKPDWNYRLLLAVNYVNHFLMVEHDTLRRIGGLNSEFDGAQDHEMILRLSEIVREREICHVPEVLYHWRKTENSTASSIGVKRYAIDAGIKAVTDHLVRRDKPATVTNLNGSTWYRVMWDYTDTPTVTIIIPFKDQVAITRECVKRLMSTDYSAMEIILVDNWSTSTEAADFVNEIKDVANVCVLRVEERFNYSRLNNEAARRSKSEYFVLMNNDLFVTDPSWLRVMINEALADPQVGVVGGKFLYPNGTVQHAGVVLGIGGVASHVHTGLSDCDPGYAGRALLAQEVSAVTAACLLIRSSIYREVSGLDETYLQVAFNDVDLCLKVRAAGYKIIWTPDFVAEHHESLSRGDDDSNPQKEARFFNEMQVMQHRWKAWLPFDPFYSKHFDLDGRPFYDLKRDVDVDPTLRRESTKYIQHEKGRNSDGLSLRTTVKRVRRR